MKAPESWTIRTLEDVAAIQTGLSKSSSRAGDFVRLPYLRVANVQDGRFDLSEVKEIDVPKDAVDRYRVVEGDLLLTEGGDFDKLGRGALWTGVIKDCVHQNHIFVVRANSNVLDRRFLALQTQGAHGRAYFQSCSKQSTNLASINSTQLKQFPVPLPPLAEQQIIADILSTWDEALEKLDALIAAKTHRKQALMQKLLTGRRRLPGFSKPWKLTRFGDLMRSEDRYADFDDDHIYHLISARRRAEGVVFREALHGRNIKTKVMKQVRAGDLVISRMQVVHGGLGVVPLECDGYYASDSYEVLVPRDPTKLSPRFIGHLCRSRRFWHHALVCSHGVHIEKMTFVMADFEHENFMIPEFVEQVDIADVLDTADKELRLLCDQRAAVDQQKRGLMQQLLTGKVRVST